LLVAAVLAAGRSTRMGVDKLYLPLAGDPILLHVVRAVRGAVPDEIWLVTRPESVERASAIADAEGCRIIVNHRAAHGIGTSIARAAEEASATIEGLLVAQGDQPLVPPHVFATLVERFRITRPPFVAARYGDVITTPVIFHAAMLGELRSLGGDRGARSVLARHSSEGEILDLADDIGLDVDDPDGYRRVCGLHERLMRAARTR
jgi:molybdenum cofactor cytidylyltransferase